MPKIKSTVKNNTFNDDMTSKIVADARKDNFVDRFIQHFLLPYCRLARLDRPIGIWLLLWPCWWSLAISCQTVMELLSHWDKFLLFFIGAIVMRGAGCTYNDIIDRDFDAKVARTKLRPIPSGQVTVNSAKLFLVIQCVIGLFVLLQFNWFTILLGSSSLLLIAIYPFMKRFTYWPQLFLGLVFNWGAFLGATSIYDYITLSSIYLYLAGVFWTIGYDTIYAHQDKEDDIIIGVKSTALKFYNNTKYWLFGFYNLTFFFLLLIGLSNDYSILFYIGLITCISHLYWQVLKLDIFSSENCLRLFKSNQIVGLLFFITAILG